MRYGFPVNHKGESKAGSKSDRQTMRNQGKTKKMFIVKRSGRVSESETASGCGSLSGP
jgi:hypothetical protein